ncbi:unnamed protein product [Lepeophtheirus salmonis]|uniref:(salmon louse) hypothetical protein n=1 Tax=Lepeophtheirus salmonis TaxID=72036 RepID=A0A0K2V4T3_LEPSM|nr:uncharacterized protein LOC121118275 [Lepeophtheirus salmonis]CAB4064399.1 unnamed protein product [Lepeophtheirus salmonis]CAF2940961.1 unnamed protein product [Lepeophtheirus salmonis]
MSHNWSSKVQNLFLKKNKKIDNDSLIQNSSKPPDIVISSPTTTTEPQEISLPFLQNFESSSVSSSGYFSQDSPHFEENNLQFKIDHLKSEFQSLSEVDKRLHKQLLALNNVIQDIRDFQKTNYGPKKTKLETCIEEEINDIGVTPASSVTGHRRLQSEDFTAIKSLNLLTGTEFRAIAEHGNSSHTLDARSRY